MKYSITIFTLIFSTFLFTGCSNSSSDNDTEVQNAAGTNSWYRPSPLVTWHIQLNDVVNTSRQVQLYDIDLFYSSTALIQQLQAGGIKVICYFSAGSYEEGRPDSDLFMPADLGNQLFGWPEEKWLDVRSENVRSIMTDRLDLAQSKGCDGVDPDNMDAYANDSGFNLTASDQLEFNRFIANEAHSRGLAVGLKNDVGQIDELIAYFDFAVNEQCFEYNECSIVEAFIADNKPVLNIEYQQKYIDDTLELQALCSDAINKQFSTLVLPLALDDSFRLSCH